MQKPATAILFLLCFALLACSPADPDPDEGKGQQELGQEYGVVADREGYSVKGYVSCDGEPLAGVVVSDGIHVTRTNLRGEYWLKSDERSDFVFVSAPSGTQVKTDGWKPGFYHRLTKSVTVARFDFELDKIDNDRHMMLAFADVHVSGRQPLLTTKPSWTRLPYDSLQVREHFIPDINDFAAGQSCPVYGISLGDMMQDMHIEKASLPQYMQTIRDLAFPTYHVVGNHDHLPDLPVISEDDQDARDIKELYMSNLGPRYYSFNAGRVHYVVLDVIQLVGGGTNKYRTRLSDAQMKWLKQDLELIQDRSSMNLVIAAHVGTHRFGNTANRPENGTVISNRDEIVSLCSGFNHVYVLSGHAHVSEVFKVNDNWTNIVHPSVCGSSWWSRTCTDGTKAAYTVYEFDGLSLRRTLKPYESGADEQMYIYADGQKSPDGNPAIIINVPAYELSKDRSGWTVTVKEEGTTASAERYDGKDPEFIETAALFYNADSSNQPKVTSHLFHYVPKNPDAMLTVTVSDSWGRSYSKTTTLTYE